MKQIEAFTLGKRFGQPELNEDSMVIMPYRGYAVIDGVTDRNGTRYDGLLSGQFAARSVGRALEQFLSGLNDGSAAEADCDPQALVAMLNGAIFEGYARNGAAEIARADWKVRASCTLTIAFHRGEELVVIAVGDSGIRINGTDILQPLKQLDEVTALLRRETFRYFCERQLSPDEAERLATTVTWQGTRHQEETAASADAPVVEALENRAFAACKRHLPSVPDWELLELIRHGIAHGQGGFQNVTDRALGYGGLDGFELPSDFVETRTYRSADIETIELFSDGYFEPGATFGIDAWEESFRRVEEEDPLKVVRYLSTKGTTATALTDDRTYLGVRFR